MWTGGDTSITGTAAHPKDKADTLPIELPYHYFPDDDPSNKPKKTWRSHANLLFANWLNFYVYQETPYDLSTKQEEHFM